MCKQFFISTEGNLDIEFQNFKFSHNIENQKVVNNFIFLQRVHILHFRQERPWLQ